VIINGITIQQALKACDLHGVIPVNTIYSRVKTRREHGTYNLLLRRAEEKRRIDNLVVDITSDDGNGVSKEGAVSPITMDTSLTSTLLQHKSVAVDCSSQSHSTSQQLLLSSSLSSSTIKTGVSRLSSKQASVARLEAKRTKLDYDGRFKAAFKDATNLVAQNIGTKGSEPVQSICTRLNLGYNLVGPKCLKRSTVYQAAQNGLAGTSPKKRGPAPKIPMILLEVAATHSQVCQAGDGELKSKDIKRLIGASIEGTEYEGAFEIESVWRKLRTTFPEKLQAAKKISVEDARAQWTTFDNLNQWFDDVKKDLIRTGLVDDIEVLDEEGNMVSEVFFKKDTKRRIINMDETHHNLSITGDRGGSRAVTYHDPTIQRGAARGVKAGRHVTGVYATNADGEALPPFYIFDSGAKSDANFRVNTEWLVGLPSIRGRFGCPTMVESESFYAVRSRGSMDEELLNQYIETVIVPLYPNMHKNAVFDANTGKLNQGPVILKLDAGPGRIVSSEAVLAKREALFERGLIIIMGLPNATSVQQEMDALYSPFKSATYARGEKVVQRKLKERGLARRNGQQLKAAAVLNLDFKDLPIVVNGNDTDDIKDKPFDLHFTKEKILWSWAKVGFVPFTRSCMKNRRVRKELGQVNKDAVLEDIQMRYDVLVHDIEGKGFNPDIYDAAIPSAAHVQRAETEDAQVEELLKSGKAFSASGQWNFCESRIGNAGVTLRAQKIQLQRNEAVKENAATKKSEAQFKALDKAQTALVKYELDQGSLTDMDWGHIIRWVLPEAKVPFLLKDLKKRDQIVAKLATLPNLWTTYIPRREVAAVVAPTIV
jgi:hypothetical protein